MRVPAFYTLLFILFLGCLAARLGLEQLTGSRGVNSKPPSAAVAPSLRNQAAPAAGLRIVSLAPSITEILFAVGLGQHLVGVTHFCAYPPQALSIPEVAGFSELNPEALLRVRPDMAVLPADKVWNKIQIEGLGIPVLPLEVRSLDGLLSGIERLGRLADDPRQAENLLGEIRNKLESARMKSSGRQRPGVLFSVMRTHYGLGQINEIAAIGRDGFYDELIRLAGGRNVYEGSLPYPRLSREAVIFLNPQVIIDVLPGSLEPAEIQDVERSWQALGSVDAVKNGRVLILNDEMHTVPGPRFIHTLDVLSAALHPGAGSSCRESFLPAGGAPGGFWGGAALNAGATEECRVKHPVPEPTVREKNK
ncbi:MAG: ABC transporter substrate-binding protein [Desulfovibrionaceae bacterium]|nr:ABC transporter substrate-binding protein [Desulfovibrionaceae bacterium]